MRSGWPRLRSLSRITMKAALPGITTGWLVALAISVGETAPLLYTAGFSDHCRRSISRMRPSVI